MQIVPRDFERSGCVYDSRAPIHMHAGMAYQMERIWSSTRTHTHTHAYTHTLIHYTIVGLAAAAGAAIYLYTVVITSFMLRMVSASVMHCRVRKQITRAIIIMTSTTKTTTMPVCTIGIHTSCAVPPQLRLFRADVVDIYLWSTCDGVIACVREGTLNLSLYPLHTSRPV